MLPGQAEYTRHMRYALLFCLFLSTVVFAENSAYTKFRELLAGGHYHSASRINGPDLIAEYPNDSEAYYLFANALYFGGDIDEADQRLEQAFERSSEPPASYLWLRGLIRSSQGRLPDALNDLRLAYQREQTYDIAMALGTVGWQLAEFDIALEAFAAAAETPRGKRELWPYLAAGRVHLALEQLPLALQLFTQAIEVFEAHDTGSSGLPSPGYVEAFYRLGQTYEALGNYTQAEVQYRAARSSDPNYAPAIAGLDRLSRRVE